MLFRSRLKGAIIGRGGDFIKTLAKEYSVEIGFSEQVSIKGPPDNVEMAKAELQSVRGHPVKPAMSLTRNTNRE